MRIVVRCDNQERTDQRETEDDYASHREKEDGEEVEESKTTKEECADDVLDGLRYEAEVTGCLQKNELEVVVGSLHQAS